jgi:hypothetical protein
VGTAVRRRSARMSIATPASPTTSTAAPAALRMGWCSLVLMQATLALRERPGLDGPHWLQEA